jgi:hypothetical protein
MELLVGIPKLQGGAGGTSKISEKHLKNITQIKLDSGMITG